MSEQLIFNPGRTNSPRESNLVDYVKYLVVICLLWSNSLLSAAQRSAGPSLANKQLQISWKEGPSGWMIDKIRVKSNNKWVESFVPSGEYTVLYSAEKPSDEPKESFEKRTGGVFPEPNYTYQKGQWKESITEVALNTAGQAFHFYPSRFRTEGNAIVFTGENEVAVITARWQPDPEFPADVRVSLSLVPKKEGYFSLASPTLGTVAPAQMRWVSVPGYFQANAIQPNFALAYAYGHGAPDRPVVYRERCASTLAPLVTTRNGITLSVIPDPGLARDPWAYDKITQVDWQLGLSHKNRKSELAPTLYYPVLGEQHSLKKTGETISWGFRYSLIAGDWFEALKHAANDIYRFREGLELRENVQSLSDRIEKMHHYLTDPKTSLWNVETYKGYTIGAQSYLGGVVGSQKDAMKNSDYGAMWMLAKLTGDPELQNNVLPLAENFKLVQQNTDDPFFKGAVDGQYYLAKRKEFVEEWGEVSEPIALTYYVMLDIGNMLLFEPDNAELKKRLQFGAERLLSWQQEEGNWVVAYDRNTREALFKDIEDVRPTFYGLLVAYRILKEPKYLAAARKGADWLIKNAIETGSYLGVCGDARYAPDFATAQTAQTFLDLYEITKEKRYLHAAVEAAKVYTGSVYTHPIPTTKTKQVNGIPRRDWEIAQAGLSFEHGGIFGSATRHGPIQLASHAGLFIRLAHLTGETLFRDMARSAAIGRHAFVDDKTSVASYYWNAMNRGAGPYPHHAWWQIGWITDYLLAETEFRSGGAIAFPRGFVTPKVGPHQSYGFAPGKVYGREAALIIREQLIRSNDPAVEYVMAQSEKENEVYVMFLNTRPGEHTFRFTIDPDRLSPGRKVQITGLQWLEGGTASDSVRLPGEGIRTLCIQYN